MNKIKIINELKQRYPDSNIILNDKQKPTEIICEVNPSSKHTSYSVAIAVIEKSKPHYHNKTIEKYEVLKGKLILNIDGVNHIFGKGDKYIIQIKKVHFAQGKETWVKTISKPEWTPEDHILVEK